MPSPAAGAGGSWSSAPPAWGRPIPTAPTAYEADLAALGAFRSVGWIIIVGAVASGAFAAVAFTSGAFTLRVTGATTTSPVPGSLVALSVASFEVTVALSVVGFLLLRSGFARLRPLDGRFSSTPAFAVTAMVGFVLLGIGFGVLLWEILSPPPGCVFGGATNSTVSSCLTYGADLLAAGALLGIGAIVALVGGIGTVIGIWRLGDRYREGLFQAAAILLIFLALIGAILLLLAARNAERKIRSGPPTLAANPFVPPPSAPLR